MARFPAGYRLEPLRGTHRRAGFRSGQAQVDDWLARYALQAQDKHLSATKVLVSPENCIAGFYTLAMGQVDFKDLPPEIMRHLPRRALPVAVLAWLGIDQDRQGHGLGSRLLAQALRDCYEAGETFAIIAVVLDCVDDSAKAFYSRWGFRELPGHANRLYLSWAELEAMATGA